MVTQVLHPGKIDSICFEVFTIKEPDYIIMLVSTYGKLVLSEGKKENIRMVDFFNANSTGTRKQVHFNNINIF